jgi:hypothetical protein
MAVEHSHSKYKSLSLKPRTVKKKRRKEGKEEGREREKERERGRR